MLVQRPPSTAQHAPRTNRCRPALLWCRRGDLNAPSQRHRNSGVDQLTLSGEGQLARIAKKPTMNAGMTEKAAPTPSFEVNNDMTIVRTIKVANHAKAPRTRALTICIPSDITSVDPFFSQPVLPDRPPGGGGGGYQPPTCRYGQRLKGRRSPPWSGVPDGPDRF